MCSCVAGVRESKRETSMKQENEARDIEWSSVILWIWKSSRIMTRVVLERYYPCVICILRRFKRTLIGRSKESENHILTSRVPRTKAARENPTITCQEFSEKKHSQGRHRCWLGQGVKGIRAWGNTRVLFMVDCLLQSAPWTLVKNKSRMGNGGRIGAVAC